MAGSVVGMCAFVRIILPDRFNSLRLPLILFYPHLIKISHVQTWRVMGKLWVFSLLVFSKQCVLCAEVIAPCVRPSPARPRKHHKLRGQESPRRTFSA